MKHKNRITNEILCAEYSAVYHYVLSLCRNEAEASDITQEAFLKALSAKESFSGESSLYTWLCAIAKRLWLNHCKKQGREVRDEDLFTDKISDDNTEESIIKKDTLLSIHKILHRMNEPYKEVFSLRVFGELSFADIATLFSKSESWARVTYYRARKMINEELGWRE